MKRGGGKVICKPFEELPFQNFIQSPLGLVPKDNGKQTRLIFHLSYDFKKSGNPSVNAGTPEHLCKVKCRDLDWAIQNSLHHLQDRGVLNHNGAGKVLQVLFYGKSDLKNAFRLAPVKVSQRCWLLMQCQDPQTNETFFFVEKTSHLVPVSVATCLTKFRWPYITSLGFYTGG